jgi:pimeloyl-ACP methyl ester carboxylesterase
MVGPGRVVQAGGLRTHYVDFPGGDPPIVLLHGLSANALAFGGLVAAGLSPAFRVVAPDLRGRGRTEKPPAGYSMADHAGDVLALLDALGLDRVVLGGHSFGAFLAIFIAAHHPSRVSKLIVIDAATTLNPRVGEMLKPSLDRLAKVQPSADAYLAEVRSAPYMAGHWDLAAEAYFRAEIRQNPDGTAQSLTSAAAVAQALEGVTAEPWRELVQRVRQPALLLNALGPYGPPGCPPLIDGEAARDTARSLADCRYAEVPGNHITMLFGEGAVVVRREIEAFVRGDKGYGEHV